MSRLLPNTEAEILIKAIKTKRSNWERNLKRYPNGLDDLPFDEWYCRKCKVLKSKYEFNFSPSSSYGIINLCKECIRKPKLKKSTKQCSKCKKVKKGVDFYFSSNRFSKSGLRPWCKVCEIEYSKKKYKKSNYNRVPDDTLVRCSRCGETKKAIEFYSRRSIRNGLRSNCKECDDRETQEQREKRKQKKINEKTKKKD